MKSKIFNLKNAFGIITILAFFISVIFLLTACEEGNPADKFYKVNAQAPTHNEYIIEGLPTEAKPFQTINFTVTITNSEYELVSVKVNNRELYGISNKYSFYMTETDANITIETKHIEEIKTSDYVILIIKIIHKSPR